MDKLVFKYDVMYVFSDRYEFKRFKKKPFFENLSDIFISRAGYTLLGCVFFVLILSLILQLIHVPIEPYIYSVISPIFCFIIFIIIIYYEQHKNVTILTSSVRKLYVSKNGKTLKIEYNDDNKRLRLKIVDMPDTDSARQDIINHLNEIVKSNNMQSDFLVNRIKFYRLNLYFGLIGCLISLSFLFVLLNMLPHNSIMLLLCLFSLSLCVIISIYSFYKLIKLKKRLLPIGLIISLVSAFVFLLVKNLLSQSQIIDLFARRSFNNVAIVLISMFISFSFGLILIYIFIKHRKNRN